MIEDRLAVEESLKELDDISQHEIKVLKKKLIKNLNARTRVRINIFGKEEKATSNFGDTGANELIGALIRAGYLPLKK